MIDETTEEFEKKEKAKEKEEAEGSDAYDSRRAAERQQENPQHVKR